MIPISIFKKKQPTYNPYDLHLKALRSQLDSHNLIDFTERIYRKQKSLLIYPDGSEKDKVLQKIHSLQECLLFYISEYDSQFEKIESYMYQHQNDFEYCKDWRLPSDSQKIIENVVSRM